MGQCFVIYQVSPHMHPHSPKLRRGAFRGHPSAEIVVDPLTRGLSSEANQGRLPRAEVGCSPHPRHGKEKHF